MPLVLRNISFEAREHIEGDFWLECPIRLTPSRTSSDKSGYAPRVAQVGKAGPFRIVVKNMRAQPVGVCVWLSLPVPGATGRDCSFSASGFGPPALACFQVHVLGPGKSLTVDGVAPPGGCCQRGSVRRFAVPEGQLTARQFQKVKVAAYPLLAGGREGDATGTLAGTVPLAQCSLFVGRIVDDAPVARPQPGVAASAAGTGRSGGALAGGGRRPRDLAVYDLTRDSDDEGGGGGGAGGSSAAAVPVVRRHVAVRVCRNDGFFVTREVLVEAVEADAPPSCGSAAALESAADGAGGACQPQQRQLDTGEDEGSSGGGGSCGRGQGTSASPGSPLARAAGAASPGGSPRGAAGAAGDVAAAAAPEAPGAIGAAAAAAPPPAPMSAAEERALESFLRSAAAALTLAGPAAVGPPQPPLAGSKRARAAEAGAPPPPALLPPWLLWDVDGARLQSLRDVLGARSGCVVLSLTPGDAFVPQEVLGTQLPVAEADEAGV